MTDHDQDFVQANNTSRRRLRDLVARLDDDALQQTVRDGWTVAALLAHMAFWDESTTVRWNGYARDKTLVGISNPIIDAVNEANKPMWLALPARTAASLALQAAEEIDTRIAGLSAEAVDYVTELGRRFMLDRSAHRNEHLDEIERFVGT